MVRRRFETIVAHDSWQTTFSQNALLNETYALIPIAPKSLLSLHDELMWNEFEAKWWSVYRSSTIAFNICDNEFQVTNNIQSSNSIQFNHTGVNIIVDQLRASTAAITESSNCSSYSRLINWKLSNAVHSIEKSPEFPRLS